MAVINDGASGGDAALWGMSLEELYHAVMADDPDPLRVSANRWEYLQRSLAQRLPVIYLGISRLAPTWTGPAGAACVDLLNDIGTRMERLRQDAATNAAATNDAYQALVSAQASMERLAAKQPPEPQSTDVAGEHRTWLDRQWQEAFRIARRANALLAGAATAITIPSFGDGRNPGKDSVRTEDGSAGDGSGATRRTISETGGSDDRGANGKGGLQPGVIAPGGPGGSYSSRSAGSTPWPPPAAPGRTPFAATGLTAEGLPEHGSAGSVSRTGTPLPPGLPSGRSTVGRSGGFAPPGKTIGGSRPGAGVGASGGPGGASGQGRVPGSPAPGGPNPSTPARPGIGGSGHPTVGPPAAPAAGGGPGERSRRGRRADYLERFPVADQQGVTPVHEGRLGDPPRPVDPGPLIGRQKVKPDADPAVSGGGGHAAPGHAKAKPVRIDWADVRYPDAGDQQVSFRQVRRGR